MQDGSFKRNGPIPKDEGYIHIFRGCVGGWRGEGERQVGRESEIIILSLKNYMFVFKVYVVNWAGGRGQHC